MEVCAVLHLQPYSTRRTRAVSSLQRERDAALAKGLPYPMLTLLDHLSDGRLGFLMGRAYRLAGYYTCCML